MSAAKQPSSPKIDVEYESTAAQKSSKSLQSRIRSEYVRAWPSDPGGQQDHVVAWEHPNTSKVLGCVSHRLRLLQAQTWDYRYRLVVPPAELSDIGA